MNKKNQIESLLFISHKPLSAKEIAKLVELDVEETQKVLLELFESYEQKVGGIRLMKIEDKYQMATDPESAELIKKFIKSELTGELTKPSLEALTVIAYRGPISKAELELIRGVNCSMILRNLLIRGLIDGVEDKQKNTVVYRITFDFLKFLGLTKVEDLPDFEKLNRNNNLDKLLSGNDRQIKDEITNLAV
ncbi:MAG: SMC-Scp complex subunit ScpB [bacterium]